MAVEAILVALIGATGPVMAAAVPMWRRISRVERQTNGALHEPLQEIRGAVLDTQKRMTRVEDWAMDHAKHHREKVA